MRRLIEFLSLHHLPAELAVRLYRLWGEEAMDILSSDPYRSDGAPVWMRILVWWTGSPFLGDRRRRPQTGGSRAGV